MNNILKNRYLLSALVACVLLLGSCKNDDGTPATTRVFGIFTVSAGDQIVEMNGTIGSSTLSDFNSLIASFPNINRINIKEVPGSMDDNINLQVSALVNQRGIATHILDNGLVASGGTDFFLAGVTRTIGTNTRIGVHSWSDGTNEATDFPVGNAVHQQYIDYYVSVGFTLANSEAFYYFTINAASASDIHWMTPAEITQYSILRP